MTKRILFTLAVCAACVTLLTGNSEAQQSSSRPSATQNAPIGLPAGPSSLISGPGPGTVVEYPALPGPAVVFPYYRDPDSQLDATLEENIGRRARLGQELGRLMTILSDSEDEEERDNATESAIQTIAEYFDLDMESRRQELDRVMQRAADMEQTLTRREAAREELVDLQMKSLELEANGLGLVPTVRSLAESARSRGYRGYGGGGQPLANMATSSRDDRIAELMDGVREDPLASAGQALHAAYENHRQATTEAATETEAALREALSDYFDADMQARRAELQEIRAGLEKLEQVVAKREEVRDEIIQVELQLILNQAAGLGFFDDSRWNTGESRLQYSMPPVVR